MHYNNIHPTAIIHPGAIIGQGTCVGPYSIIGSSVVIGKNNNIASHVVIEGRTSIGDENRVYQFASIGSPPQDQKWKGQETELHIGSRNQIREYVTIQPATELSGATKVGNDNLFMACSHVAHDVSIGNNCWVANSAAIAGHAVIADNVILGGLSGVHQFVSVGSLAFIAAGSMVAQDIPPFCMAQGDRAKLCGINQVGMQRNGYSSQEIRQAKTLFRKLFFKEGSMQTKLSVVENEYCDSVLAQNLCTFIRNASRGVASMDQAA